MRNDEEHRIQAGIIKAVEHLPHCRWLHAIPNGGARNVVTGKRLKDEGVKSGIPDLFLPIPGETLLAQGYLKIVHHGLYIEVKTPKRNGKQGGRLSSTQKSFRDHAIEQGYEWKLVRSTQEGVDCILAYLGLEKTA